MTKFTTTVVIEPYSDQARDAFCQAHHFDFDNGRLVRRRAGVHREINQDPTTNELTINRDPVEMIRDLESAGFGVAHYSTSANRGRMTLKYPK